MASDPTYVPDWLACDRLAFVMTRQGFPLEVVCATVERAAVYEFDAGMTREAAERRALQEIGAIKGSNHGL